MSANPNTLLTPTIIAKEALMVLENELVMGALVHRAHSSEFQSKIGSTVLVRKPTTFEATAFSSTVAMQVAEESSVPVVLDKHMDVSFEVGTQELSLDVVSFSEQFIQPAMRAQAQEMDKHLCSMYAGIAPWYPIGGTAGVSDVAGARAVQSVMKAPLSQRRMVVGPMTEAKFLSLDAFLHAEKRGDTRAVRDAHMGRIMGYDWYMDQNIHSHTIGSAWASTTNVKDGWGKGKSTVEIKGVAAAKTVLANDVFRIKGRNEWYRVTAQAVATGATRCILVIDPPTQSATVAADTTVEAPQTGQANLAFHKNCIALVSAPLAPPIGGANSGVLSYKGLTCRVVYDYNTTWKKNVISIDTLYGAKVLDSDLGCRFMDSSIVA